MSYREIQQQLKQHKINGATTIKLNQNMIALQAELKRIEQINEAEKLDIICPITYEIFLNPVIISDGHTYEDEAISQVMKTTKTSPLTREVLTADKSIDTEMIKKVQKYLELNPNMKDEQYIERIKNVVKKQSTMSYSVNSCSFTIDDDFNSMYKVCDVLGFTDCDDLETIIISSKSFNHPLDLSECTNLKTLIISSDSFNQSLDLRNCHLLEEVKLPANYDSDIKVYANDDLKYYTVGDDVRFIGHDLDWAFENDGDVEMDGALMFDINTN